MANKGFIDSVETRISQIRVNLTDLYYLGFPIVKELLANADDAGASRLHLGWARPPVGAKHPLLDRPGMFVVNDGQFRSLDEEGIRRLGLGSRGGDIATIGRFGLGLKSAFHLCDAFFYLASGRDGNRSVPVLDVLNPWSHDFRGKHPDWDSFSPTDAALLRDILSPCCSTPDWFAIWLPLRSERDSKPHIMLEYPGDRDTPPPQVLGPPVMSRIAKVLPLLSNLRTVQLWRAENGSAAARLIATCQLADGSQRRRPGEQLGSATGQSPLSGCVTVVSDGGTPDRLTFAGVEAQLSEDLVAQLRGHPKWPHRPVLDSKTEDWVDRPDKATPHVAVQFMRSPTSGINPALRLSWASYLPVGEHEPGDCVEIDAKHDWEVVLHGAFFVDAGRRLIDFAKSPELGDERSVRVAWNAELRASGVLPLVIGALQRLTQGTEALDVDGASTLTRALSSTASLRDRETRQLVCAQFQWLCLVTEGDRRWRAVPAEQRILSLPIHDSVTWSLVAMPSLGRVSKQFHLSPASHPRLAARDPETLWPHEAVSLVLTEVEDLGQVPLDHIRYRIEVIRSIMGGRPHEHLRSDCVAFLRALLLGRKLSELAEHREVLADLLRVIPQDTIVPVPLPCRSVRSQDILRTLNGVIENDDVVFLPEELIDALPDGAPSLPSALVTRTLAAMDSCDQRLKGVPHFCRVAAHLILRSEDRRLVVQECKHLALFRDERSETTVMWSIAALAELLDTSRVATRTEYTDLRWQRAVGLAVKAPFALIHDEVGRAIFAPPPPPCDAAWSVQMLCGHPDLSPPTQRRELLEHLLSKNSLNNAPDRRAIRYLLHGTRAPSAEDAVLFEPRTDADATVWDRLAGLAMHASGERWRLIDAGLVEPLSNAHRAALSIDSIDAQGVEHLLHQVDLSVIDWRTLSRSDRVQLLVFIEDNALLLTLPIHETIDGRVVRIDGNTFRDSPWAKRTPDLASGVSILRTPADQRAAARQTQLAPSFDAHAVLRLGLAASDPSRHWPSILAAAAEWLVEPNSDQALKDRLASTPWLPTKQGEVVAPLDVVKLPHDSATIGLGLLPQGSHSLRPRDALQDELLANEAFRVCEEHLVLPLREQFARLAGLLSDVASCRIGRIDIPDTDRLEDWLLAFDGRGAEHAMPVSRLIARFKSQELRRLCIDELIPALALDITDERLTQVLTLFAGVLKGVDLEVRDRIRPVFLQYLALVNDLSDVNSVLSAIHLPSKDGRWRRTQELCVDAHGVSDSCLLRHDCVEALAGALGDGRSPPGLADASMTGSVATVPAEDLLHAVAASSSSLESFFAPWARVADEELIGALLGLFGDDPGTTRYRSRFLDATKLTVFRNSLEWQTFDFSQVSGARETLDDMMRKQRFVVSVFDDTRIRVTSLVGTPFDAPLSTVVRTLLIGDRAPRFLAAARIDGMGVRVYELRLRRVDPAMLGRDACNEILRETARALLSDVYCRTIANFDDKWNSLAKADQVDLEFTRTWLLRQAPIYLEQLGLRTHERLGPLLRELKDADRHEHLEQHDGVPESRRKGAVRRSAAAAALHRMLSEDGEIAEALIAAVRRKVGDDAQYEPQSIPFELFQNADDAVTELAALHVPARQLCEQERHWVVELTPEGVTFVHHGRCVNQFRLGSADCADRGFNQDLEKMLVLQASDKQLTQGTAPVTGKFGLGFKSTFLVSDHPLIWSGRLRCVIHGALLPLHDDTDRPSIERFLRVGDEANRATIVALPLRPGISADVLLSKFSRLFPVQMIFARSLRSCEIGNGSERFTFAWQADALDGCTRVWNGALPITPTALPGGLRALVLRAGVDDDHSTALLMLLDRRGFVAMPEEVPSVWVTTPTKERLDLGVAVNASFAVDVGRAQLARESGANDRLAETIAGQLGDSLIQFADACLADWPRIRAALSVDDGITIGDFWQSLWELISQLAHRLRNAADSPGAARLLSIALCGPNDGAFARLVSVTPVVPTMLPTPLAGLIRADAVRFVVQPWLAEQSAVFAAAMALPSSAARISAGSAVSATVWSTLDTLCAGRSRPVEIALDTLIGWEIDHDTRFDAPRSQKFAFLADTAVKKHLDSLDSAALRESVSRAEFLAESGEYEPATDLLIADVSMDEGLRAAFAPPNRVLARGYGPDSLSFFHVCRGQFQAPARLLAEWVASAHAEPTRMGVIQYLLRGELRSELCAVLVEQYPDCWVFSLGRHSPDLAHLSPQQAIEFLAKLGVIRGWDDLLPSYPIEPEAAPRVQLDPTRCLQAVFAWWARENHNRLIEYRQRVYPQHVAFDGLSDWSPDNRAQKRAWLTVFLLGAFHTMGRVQPGQHRSFLEYCDRQGWLDRFANEPTEPATWVHCLERYFGEQVQDAPFLQWMLQLPRIYVLSRWLPDYAEAFLSIDRPGAAAEPFDILATRASTRFQGGGVDAPPLGRVLGFGYCFVLRELSRHGAIDRTDIGRDCFVPTRRLRVMLAGLGCPLDIESGAVPQSRDIYAFLAQHMGAADALFGGSFDIPLQIVAENPALQSELFGLALADNEGATDDNEW